jgi:aspartate 1-decarboxylase
VKFEQEGRFTTVLIPGEITIWVVSLYGAAAVKTLL